MLSSFSLLLVSLRFHFFRILTAVCIIPLRIDIQTDKASILNVRDEREYTVIF